MEKVFSFLRNGRLDMKRIKKLLFITFLTVASFLALQVAFDGWQKDRLLHRLSVRNNYSENGPLNQDGAELQQLPVVLTSFSSQHNNTTTTTTTTTTTSKPKATESALLSSSVIRQNLAAQLPSNASKNKELQVKDERPSAPAPNRVLKPEHLLRVVGNVIASFPPVPSQQVVRILVVTYFRAGSTFIGDILQQNWKTFYHFEPLHYMSFGLRIKDNDVPEALNLLENIFRCQYSNPSGRKYLLWASQERNNFLIKRNHFLWVTCRIQPQSCYRDDFAEFICRRAPVQVMKVTRLNMADVQRFVANNPDLDLRVIHLVRDPRGTISSRKVLNWCNTTSCSDFRVLCKEMEQDALVFDALRQSNPKRYVQLRYEDLSVQAEKVTRQLYAALGLPFTSNVRRFLKLSTNAREVDKLDPYSTRRNSSQAPFVWKQKLNTSDITRIQKGCARVLQRYHYDIYSPAMNENSTIH